MTEQNPENGFSLTLQKLIEDYERHEQEIKTLKQQIAEILQMIEPKLSPSELQAYEERIRQLLG